MLHAGDVWFLISSKGNIVMELGYWKTKEEACEVFSNSDIIGWRTTFQYCKGQVHHERKTVWVMQVFSTTQKRLCDDNEKKVTLLKLKVLQVYLLTCLFYFNYQLNLPVNSRFGWMICRKPAPCVEFFLFPAMRCSRKCLVLVLTLKPGII